MSTSPKEFLDSPGSPGSPTSPGSPSSPGSPKSPGSPPTQTRTPTIYQEEIQQIGNVSLNTFVDPIPTENDLVHGQNTSLDDNLGTPTGLEPSGFFEEDSNEFMSHRFVGPRILGDDTSTRCLHGLRRVNVHAKPPRFVSEASAQITPQQRNSVLNSDLGTIRGRSTIVAATQDLSPQPNEFSVTFTESSLGFTTNVFVSEKNELVVQVSAVERDTPAHRAGIITGDSLISVNGHVIEPHMTESQVVDIITQASNPRNMIFSRECKDILDLDASDSMMTQSKSLNFLEKKAPPGPLFGRLSSATKYLGSAIVGTALNRKKAIIHNNSFCDGCGMDPIVGSLWTCSVCSNYNLCTSCYEHGTHGMENTDSMKELQEAIVQYKLQKKCKQFSPEFMLSLRRDVCKGRVDKLEYMGGWLADLIGGTPPSRITVRGIEIPSLTPLARQRFVSNLMPLVSNRIDIEVNIEWLPDETELRSLEQEDDDTSEKGEKEEQSYEKLRIWISDKKTRTSSPFT
jgi:antitoxin (DNA-binding transcriptional repressor) of toxin-antitoxin stability system